MDHRPFNDRQYVHSILFPFACTVLLAGTLWGGWITGHAANRWGNGNALEEASKQLQGSLETRHGNWRLQSEDEFPHSVVQMLQRPTYISRTYTHEQTGDLIQVAVIVGRTGPISVHTPEICYSGQDYQVSSTRKQTTIHDRGGNEHSFWDVKLAAKDSPAAPLRVLYAWSTGGTWLAAENPRFQHAGEAYLYKIQLAAVPGHENEDFDPCQDFLEGFLADLARCLIRRGIESRPPSL